MALTTCLLNNTGDPFVHPDGSLVTATALTITLVDAISKLPANLVDIVSGEYVCGYAVIVMTDSNGCINTPLWPNLRGEFATMYKISFPSTVLLRPFYVQIPNGQSSITIMSAKSMVVSMVPQPVSLLTLMLGGTQTMGTSIVTASTIYPNGSFQKVSGTTTVNTIYLPYPSFVGNITLIPSQEMAATSIWKS